MWIISVEIIKITEEGEMKIQKKTKKKTDRKQEGTEAIVEGES